MRILSVLVVAAVVSNFTADASVQGSGYPIVKRPVTQEQLAQGIQNGCPQTLFNVTCPEFLIMVQAVDPDEKLTLVSELPAYIRKLVRQDCPQGYAVLYRYLRPANKLDFQFSRVIQADEGCLFNSNTNRVVMPLSCANGIKWYEAMPERVIRETTMIQDSLRITFGDSIFISRLNGGSVDTIRGSTIRAIGRTHIVFVSDPRLASKTIQLPAPDPIVRTVTVRDTVVKTDTLKVGRKLIPRLLEDGLFFAGGYFLGQENVSCKFLQNGAPVNPPNQLSPTFGLRFGWPPRKEE